MGVDVVSGRIGDRLLSGALRVSRRHGWLLVVLGLLACWATTMLFGGASIVPPHYFYVPILFAGIRFGAGGSFVTAVASAVLAGPLTYADVATRTPQSLLDWGTRGFFFIVIGQALTAMTSIATSARAEELADLRTAKALWTALDEGRFQVYFQPVVSMGRVPHVVGVEALVRLNDPQRGIVSPDEFIPLAERSGLIRPIGEVVLRQACTDAAHWRDLALIQPGFTLSVNVSPRQLDASDFCDRVAGILAETGLDASWLQLEITETALAEDPRRLIETLHQLRRLGIRLALDDFGTGHSTLAELQRLPVDVIKLDRAFVATLGQGAHGSAIAQNVIALARSLGLTTVAEGVETDVQAALLARLRCDLGQGYLYGRPTPEDEFALMLMADRRPGHDSATGVHDDSTAVAPVESLSRARGGRAARSERP